MKFSIRLIFYRSVMDYKQALGSITCLLHLIIIIHILVFFSDLAELSAEETEPEWLIDEDSWQEDIGFDTEEFPQFQIDLRNISIKELLQIPGLIRDDIERILSLRDKADMLDIETLQESGLKEDKITSIIKYFSFRSSLPMIYLHTERYYYRILDGQYSSRYYHKSELRGSESRLGFVLLSDYGRRDLTRNYSYYLSHQSNTIIKQLVLGRYRLSLGQGISYAPVSGFSKSSATTSHPMKNYSPLKSHSNPYKIWSLEGIALNVEVGPIEIIPFYSNTQLDASISEDAISTFYPYGTDNEDWKSTVREKIEGIAVRLLHSTNSFGLYYSQNRFDRVFANPARLSSYKTSGSFLYYRTDNFALWGEYARISNKQGLVAGIRLGRGVFQQLLLYRSYEKDMPVWHGNPFSSQSSFDNEEGLYYGLRIRPSRFWTLNCFFDLWRHPATRYFEKMPTTRSEQYLQVIHNRQVDTFRLKFQHKNYEKYRVLQDIAGIRDEHKTVTALDWKHNIRTDLSHSCGIEYITHYIPEVKNFKKGILLFENLSWKYRKTGLVYQINFFRSDISHYLYERSLDGMWESRPLSGDDIYSFLVIKADVAENIKVQGKFSYFFQI